MGDVGVGAGVEVGMKQEWSHLDLDDVLNARTQTRRALKRIGAATQEKPPTFQDSLATVVFLSSALISIDGMCKRLGLEHYNDEE